jgi:glycosyltransferase involved in cell wall biosynthesis
LANRATYRRNAAVIAVSDGVAASIRSSVPVDVVVHGTDPRLVVRGEAARAAARTELDLPGEALVIGTVGNFTAKKDHATLLRAVALLRRAMPDVRLAVVGQGPLQRELRGRCRELGLEDSVVFTGYRDDATTLMGAFDVFALSSVYEGLSIALLEAMALARPVVVTRVGGNPEVVDDGKDGVLVPPGDPPRMAEALGRLLADRELRRRLGEAARRRAAGFDIRTAVRRMEEVYGELLG